MKKSKIYFILFSSFILNGCVTNTPPICSNQAKVGGMIVDIPVYEIRNAKRNPDYLSGASFGYQWYNRGAFLNTKQCDSLAQ